MNGPKLSVRDLSLRFGEVAALSGVSFDVRHGELLAVIGPNGAGKSSLFNVLTRFCSPTSGSVELDGENLLEMRADKLARRGLSRTFQNVGLSPHLSALVNVMVGRHHLMRSGTLANGLALPGSRREERQHRTAALEALKSLGIGAHAEQLVGELPYGVQKRVEIARALASEPQLLLLDEPVAGMGSAERAEVVDAISTVRARHDVSIVLVEHDIAMVMRIADRVVVLDFGSVIADGPPSLIQTDQGVIDAYLGREADS